MKYPLSVSQLISTVEGSHEGLLDLLNELEMRGLLKRREQRQRRGRPQRIMETTTLGERFIKTYNQLMKLQLRSNERDIRAAVHQAELAKRLEESGISPYARFNEIVELARNIANSAQHSTTTR
jgi:predicted ArsR family transcriptional regulator